MNPVGSAARRGLKYTLHNDSPVVLMGLFKGYNTFLKGIYAAVNRKTITGRILDDGSQKISIYDALKGVTINAAWQANEDGEKGSIEVGKVADLIILNKNPLELEPEEIDTLNVEATIKKGNLVFGRYPSIGTKQIILN
jgi:predicted amidohydrolase YtcJ